MNFPGVVLCYHRVLAEPDVLDPDGMTAAVFARHMRVLRRFFRPVPLADLVNGARDGSVAPGSVAVTFDDGYADNLEVALPILRQEGIPATVFVATAGLDGVTMWNDRIIEGMRRLLGSEAFAGVLAEFSVDPSLPPGEAVRRLVLALKFRSPRERDEMAGYIETRAGGLDQRKPLMMGPREVAALARAGITIGAHTVSHPILCSLPDAAALAEMVESRARLEGIVGSAVTQFAYPNGRPNRDYDARHVEMARSAGFDFAVSTAEGRLDRRSPRYELPRIRTWPTSSPNFAARIVGTMLFGRQTEFAAAPAVVAGEVAADA